MFTLKLKTGNAAFTDYPQGEVKHILLGVVEKLGSGHTEGVCIDSNGNTVGSFKLTNR